VSWKQLLAVSDKCRCATSSMSLTVSWQKKPLDSNLVRTFYVFTWWEQSVNLWRVVVPRGAAPPDSVVDPQPPLHWGYSGGANTWPTPTGAPSRGPMKRHHSESDECDDVFSEESSKEQ
jgi:hypothetical protein